jgi:phosphomethylpyrimidine synthase
METQLEMAQARVVSAELQQAAATEKVNAQELRDLVASGRVVTPKNNRHPLERILPIEQGLRTKVNANIGTSGACTGVKSELEKLEAAVAAGTDSVMDLSTGPDYQDVRHKILERSPVMVGAVPICAAAARLREQGSSVENVDVDDLFANIETQCAEGVDYITVHCGATRDVIRTIAGRKRGGGRSHRKLRSQGI